MKFWGSDKKEYETLGEPKSGGEGDVYCVAGMPEKVIKILHKEKRTEIRKKKLEYMIANPPSGYARSHVAWPEVILFSNGIFSGYVMPKVSSNMSLSAACNFVGDSYEEGFSYRSKIRIAGAITKIMKDLHEAGYVIGDFNPKNITINPQNGEVRFVDADSYHIVINKAENEAFRCAVAADGYWAPELLRKAESYLAVNDVKDVLLRLPLDTFTKETDYFCLAIHIFSLLMNGFTPFCGIGLTETASTGNPGVGNKAILAGNYCFATGKKPQAAAILQRSELPGAIVALFDRAFIDGFDNPSKRPNPDEWLAALHMFFDNLKNCRQDARHQGYAKLNYCPLCAATKRFNRVMEVTKVTEERKPVAPVAPPPPPPLPQGLSTTRKEGTLRKILKKVWKVIRLVSLSIFYLLWVIFEAIFKFLFGAGWIVGIILLASAIVGLVLKFVFHLF